MNVWHSHSIDRKYVTSFSYPSFFWCVCAKESDPTGHILLHDRPLPGFVVATRFSTDLRSAVRSRSVGTVGTEELAEAAREQENPEEQQNCPYELKFLGLSGLC